MSLPQIVIIHDDWDENYPLIISLKEKYGEENVVFIKNSQAGIDYIVQTPTRKTIVILDYKFKTGEPTGGEVFKKIREKSALIYVIIVTKNQPRDIDPNDFVEFVNSHAIAIADSNKDYTHTLDLVATALKHLSYRADIILEEWILEKNEEERNKPYMATYNGKIYSLNEILQNIRQQTRFGEEFTNNVLGLAIDLVMKKQKEH